LKITRTVRSYKKKFHSGHLKVILEAFYENDQFNMASFSDYSEVKEVFEINK